MFGIWFEFSIFSLNVILDREVALSAMSQHCRCNVATSSVDVATLINMFK